jgi:radical SAM superfamily enzyme YgiQ (UPF0313 family)
MKILLIQPAKAPSTIGGEDINLFEPVALEYLAAGVADCHDVRILDMRLEKDLRAVLEAFVPDIVGITAYTVNVNTVKNLFREIKAWNPAAFTVAGGHHATVMPGDFHEPAIDLAVMGEGVFVFREIVRRLENKESMEGIAGTCYGKEGAFVKIPPAPHPDLDALPVPRRDLTTEWRSSYYTEWMKPLASIRTSKGCPFRCSFCALWKLTGGKYLTRRPERIVEELAGIREEFVFFDDDESLIDAKRMAELARRIREAGIRKRFFLYGRSDTVVRHPELIEAWREAGLERIFMGMEFFRDEDLQFIRKGTSARTNERAIKILQGLGVDIYASFMVRPEFSREDFRQYRSYCRGLGLNFATFSVLTPLPGTDFFEDVKDRLITRDYDHFDFIHTLLPTRLPMEEFYEELYGLYKKAVPLRTWMSFIGKFPLAEVPSVIGKSNRIFRRIRNAHRGYNSL